MDYFTSRLILRDQVLTRSNLGVPTVQKKPPPPQFLEVVWVPELSQNGPIFMDLRWGEWSALYSLYKNNGNHLWSTEYVLKIKLKWFTCSFSLQRFSLRKRPLLSMFQRRETETHGSFIEPLAQVYEARSEAAPGVNSEHMLLTTAIPVSLRVLKDYSHRQRCFPWFLTGKNRKM